MKYLLGSSALIALIVQDHEHHPHAAEWFRGIDGSFALCPITEGALSRFLMRVGEHPATVRELLRTISNHPRAEFWPDSISYLDLDLAGVTGYRQLTDAYLVGLAASKGGCLATLDEALAAAQPQHTLLLPRS